MKTTSRIRLGLIAAAAMLAFAPVQGRTAETCSVESFGEAVDESAQALRAFSTETQPRLRSKLENLRDHKGWSGPDYEGKGLALIHDDKLDAFDAEAATLLSRIDALGTPDAANPESASCEKLDELKVASSELMAVMRAKSDHLIARIDDEIASTPKAAPPPAPVAETPGQIATSPNRVPVTRTESREPTETQPDLSPIRPMPSPRANPPIADIPQSEADASEMAEDEAHEPDLSSDDLPELQADARPKAPEPEPTPPPERADRTATPPPSHIPHDLEADLEQDDAGSWSTTTAQAVIPPQVNPPATPGHRPPPHDAYRQDNAPPGYAAPAPGDPPGMPYTLPDEQAALEDPYGAAGEDGYTIDEIREATRGFFGTVSTSLASVIEHAFQKSGRPTAYVLGQEGGAAFLAGLRYGEGTLFLRNGGQQKVYWHGPSLGYDIGGDGSRTLFLIYSLDQADTLFRRFTGVDGSAYLVGGVGMTLLKGGPVTMAPIRSGIGLRLGASIGYLRFTPRPTWNPF